jgi:DnaK suppressor protein
MIKREVLEYVRYRLVRQMEDLRGAASRTADRMKGETGNLADIFDQAAAEYDWSVELTIRDRDSRQLREIRETILRIDRGQFGICEKCGKSIAPKRLLLTPMSRLCTSCKAQIELHQSHASGRIPGHRISENYAA